MFFYFLAFLVTVLAIPFYLRIAKKFGILDLPTERSAHSHPIVRGSGLILAMISLSFWIAVDFPKNLAQSLVVFSFLGITLLGWIDDLKSISATRRLFLHFIFSLAITLSVKLTQNDGTAIFLGDHLLSAVFSILFLMTCLNFFNFMDGINGIALIQTTIAAITFSVLCPQFCNLSILICVCSLALLPYNFPRAKVFLGDAGSGFLGLVVGYWGLLLGMDHFLYGVNSNILIYLSSILPFLVDPTITLANRFRRGCKLKEAHSEHAYQHLARKIGHTRTTLFYSAASVFLGSLAYSLRNTNITLQCMVFSTEIFISGFMFFRLGSGTPKIATRV